MPNWTPEEDALMFDLWRAGHSASIIAARFHGRSRCSVIGRIHRKFVGESRATAIRLPRGAQVQEKPLFPYPGKDTRGVAPSQKSAVQRTVVRRVAHVVKHPEAVASGPSLPKVPKAKVAMPSEPETKPRPARLPEPTEPVTIMALAHGMCRWPYGDKPPFTYCGRRSGDSSWCDVHRAVVYTRVSAKEERAA